jgi:hypothetical protein
MLVAAGKRLQPVPSQQQGPESVYRTLFSMASLVVTVQGAGLAFKLLAAHGSADPMTALARPLVGAATVYFFLNTGLIATAIALSTREPIARTWNTNSSGAL